MTTQAVEVIPGIFEKDPEIVRQRVQQVAPYVKWIQIDIADGKLVPNMSLLDPSLIRDVLKYPVNYELHMMVDDPISRSDAWVEAGVRRLLWHVESNDIQQLTNNKKQLAEKVLFYKNKGVEVGLVLDKQTSVEEIFPFLDLIDCVLIMTIQAGFSGQKFLPDMLEKVRAVRERAPRLPIEVDGGINFDTGPISVRAGATRLVSTSTIYNSEHISEAINRLRNS